MARAANTYRAARRNRARERHLVWRYLERLEGAKKYANITGTVHVLLPPEEPAC